MKTVNVFTTRLEELVLAGSEESFSSIYLVMDYMPYDLKSLMTNNKFDFNERHAITILYNILCGLNFLHSANVIHRDLKPANILINSDCEIKICDFGISRTFEEEESE
jgi:serine/threonine protein kinase